MSAPPDPTLPLDANTARWRTHAPAIRFFTREGPPEYPYAALADLVEALNFCEGALSVLIKLIAPSEAHEMIVADGPDGPLTCVSHYLTLFFIEDSIKSGNAPAFARQEYLDSALNHLIERQCSGLSHEDALAYMNKAHRNSVKRAMKPRLAN